MRAITHSAPGGPEVLTLRDVPTPSPGPRELLVGVRAAGLNRADVIQRRGGYPAPAGWPADIPGLEFAGEVEAVGPEVTAWRVGDRVMGLVGGGAHAQYVAIHEAEAIAVPPMLTLTEAAAVPEAFLTAWDALTTRGRLAAGERVLLHAVGSGVGTVAIQLAKRLGATVLGTSRTLGKLEQCRPLGLDQGIDTSAGSFREAVSVPVNVIVDVLGGPAFADNLAVLAPRGRLVLLGFLQGPKVETSLDPILRKRLEVIGTVMRTRGPEERAALAAEFTARLAPWFATAQPVRPVIGATFAMADIAEAHRAMEADAVFGKIVLEWR
ncbi:MAG TPA: NAD(P)H-quinone oxidoreductase [Gemmatimonadales bacterium]